jgi:hypothetical protein
MRNASRKDGRVVGMAFFRRASFWLTLAGDESVSLQTNLRRVVAVDATRSPALASAVRPLLRLASLGALRHDASSKPLAWAALRLG